MNWHLVNIDWGLVAQVLTALAAIAAIVTSFRSARQSISSAREIAIDQINASREQASAQTTALMKQTNAQIAASVLSANRQAWINDLRNTLSEFIVSVHHLKSFLLVPPEEREFTSIVAAQNQAYLHLSRMRLLINPKEEDHVNLIVLANALYDGIKLSTANEQKTTEIDLIVRGQSILKREWERVKSLT